MRLAQHLFRLLAVGAVWLAAIVVAHQTGAGDQACGDMAPRHHKQTAQTTASPFAITQEFEPSEYNVSTTYQVALHAADRQYAQFKGFFCQGRRADSAADASGDPIGTFVDFPAGLARGKKCFGKLDVGATHVDGSMKSLVILNWHSPSADSGPVEIRCTMLQEFATFWVQVRPNVGEIPTSSSLPTVQQSTVPPTDLMQISFEGCGVTKSCYRRPSSCSGVTDCTYVYTHRMVTRSPDPAEAVVEIELSAHLHGSQGWVAVGYSHDRHMGDDDVLACEAMPSGKVAAKNLWDIGEQNVIDNPADGAQYLTDQVTTQRNGFISCRFQRALKTPNSQQDFDLSNSWTLMFGMKRGGTAYLNSPLNGKHERNPVTSIKKISANDTIIVIATAEERPLLAIHAILMVVSWMGASTVAIFAARFMRNASKKPRWFTFHRGILIGVLVFTGLGFAAVFVDVKGFTESYKLHAVLGIVTTCLAFIQPIMALFRCAPDSERRFLFNWMHRVIGILTQLLAIFSIFLGLHAYKELGYRLEKTGITLWAMWLCLSLFIWIGLEVYAFFRRRSGPVLGRSSMAYRAAGEQLYSPMASGEEDEPEAEEEPKAEKTNPTTKGHRVERVTLFIFIAVCFGLSIALATVIALSASD